MTEIQTKVTVKKNNGAVVSADLNLYNDSGDVVKTITIVESEALKELEDRIDEYENTYVDLSSLNTILKNTDESRKINATTLSGYEVSNLALKSDLGNELDPIAHANSDPNRYGAGTTTQYGHVKVRDDLVSNYAVTGEVLSAYQGKILNDKILNIQNTIQDLTTYVYEETITANKNNVGGRVTYRAVDFGEYIGVFMDVVGLAFTVASSNTTLYYDISTSLVDEAYRPTSEINHVTVGMGGCVRGIKVTEGGRIQLRRITNTNNTYNNAVYTSFHYFI